MISRRHYLAGTWAAFAGGTLAAVVRPFPDDSASGADPLVEEFAYRGRTVAVTRHGRDPHVRIDGTKDVHLHAHTTGHADGAGPHRGYLTHAMPFAVHASPQDLARAVIDAEEAGSLVV
ncbi:hypothetical protein [Kineococcus sp. SYSU DK003]|uniref:hypothetical protein n=1 Tax=Kineococcus sp. SYSU DK003 TaxID=3383124 RepID=UPI003D7DC664